MMIYRLSKRLTTLRESSSTASRSHDGAHVVLARIWTPVDVAPSMASIRDHVWEHRVSNPRRQCALFLFSLSSSPYRCTRLQQRMPSRVPTCTMRRGYVRIHVLRYSSWSPGSLFIQKQKWLMLAYSGLQSAGMKVLRVWLDGQSFTQKVDCSLPWLGSNNTEFSHTGHRHRPLS